MKDASQLYRYSILRSAEGGVPDAIVLTLCCRPKSKELHGPVPPTQRKASDRQCFFVFFFDSGQCGDECRLSVIFVVSSFVTQYPLPRLVYPTVDRRSTCGTPLLVVVFVCFGWPPGEEDARDDLSLCLSLFGWEICSPAETHISRIAFVYLFSFFLSFLPRKSQW